eukprot:TRINITY_DN18019_c0_g1_i1.p1 TRINITY_DN18019_c0_g1~~TRINITY_DN18019_c0_g1_i1.p1  ORF type:complete len:659 (+),score=294.27 TRINITY_DN18019_c0_g1_i1:160-2136(+)
MDRHGSAVISEPFLLGTGSRDSMSMNVPALDPRMKNSFVTTNTSFASKDGNRCPLLSGSQLNQNVPTSPTASPRSTNYSGGAHNSLSSGEGPTFTEVAADNPTMYNPPDEKAYGRGYENSHFRWNLLWLLLFSVVIVPLPLWLTPLNCMAGQLSVMAVSGWGILVLLYCGLNNLISMCRMYMLRYVDWVSQYPRGSPTVYHMVAMAGYKEPLELMCTTLDSLVQQSVADKLITVVGLEEGTPDFDAKYKALMRKYTGKFFHFMVTRHPRGWLPGEIPGKCSNINYAMRTAMDYTVKHLGVDVDNLTATTCDTDNLYPSKYFEFLGYEFLTLPNRYEVVWQAPLFYNLGLDERPWFVRNTGLLRSFYMTGFLIAQNINTMSVYSFSAKMLIKGKFFHHRYQMDDIIYTLTCMAAIQKRVIIREIPYPMVSGPTSGEGWWSELKEWALQIRRWTIGAAEVFHYFMIKFRRFDFSSGLGYGLAFSHYYGFILGTMGTYLITGTAALVIYGKVLPEDSKYHCGANGNGFDGQLVDYIMMGGLAANYLIFILVGIIDSLATSLMGIDEDISFLRKVFHWIMTMPTILMYNLVQYYGMWDIAIRGKSACSHKPSKKGNLVAGSELPDMQELNVVVQQPMAPSCLSSPTLSRSASPQHGSGDALL